MGMLIYFEYFFEKKKTYAKSVNAHTHTHTFLSRVKLNKPTFPSVVVSTKRRVDRPIAVFAIVQNKF